MEKRGVTDFICQSKVNKILLSFTTPKTPRQIEKELGIKKLKLKPFLEKKLVKSLNPMARKARFYVLTHKAKNLLNLPCQKNTKFKDWDLIGWIRSSPRQRLVVLLAMDLKKRTSEEIRIKASKLNPHLSRISTKGILKELADKDLIETKMNERKRYYWISEKGKVIVNETKHLPPIKPL